MEYVAATTACHAVTLTTVRSKNTQRHNTGIEKAEWYVSYEHTEIRSSHHVNAIIIIMQQTKNSLHTTLTTTITLV